jgi:hypothetical protein
MRAGGVAVIRPSAIDGQMRDFPPWDDKQIARYQFRVALFKRRGLDEHYAEELADRAFERDFEKDDRRYCIECAELQRSGNCFAAQQGRIAVADRRLTPIRDQLHRCEAFKWQTPG